MSQTRITIARANEQNRVVSFSIQKIMVANSNKLTNKINALDLIFII